LEERKALPGIAGIGREYVSLLLLEESTRRDGLELPRPFDQSIAKSKTSLLKRVSGATTIIAPSLSASARGE
jgi:hypothetical protein